MLGVTLRAAHARRIPLLASQRLAPPLVATAKFHASARASEKRRLSRRGFTIPGKSSSLKLSRARITPDLQLRVPPSEREGRERQSVSLLRNRFSKGLDRLLGPVLDPTAPIPQRQRAMFQAASFFTNSIPRVCKLSDPVLWNQMLGALAAVGERRHPIKLFAIMKRNGIYPDMATFTTVFRSMRQELLRRRREATDPKKVEPSGSASASQSWEQNLDERGPEAKQWMPSSMIIQHQYFVAAMEQFRIATLDYYRMTRGEIVASTGLPSPVSHKNQRRNTGKHNAMFQAPSVLPEYARTDDPNDLEYAQAATQVSQRSHRQSNLIAQQHTRGERLDEIQAPEPIDGRRQDDALIPSPDRRGMTRVHEPEDAPGPLVEREFHQHSEEIADAYRALERRRTEPAERDSAISVQALVERRHQELDEESRGHLTPWQRMYLTKRKALLRAASNWEELATAYSLAIGLGAMLGRPNQAWAMYSNISLPGARRGLPWPHGLIFYTVLRHLTPAPNEARDLAHAEREANRAQHESLHSDGQFDPYAALGPNALVRSLTAYDAARVTLETLTGRQGAGLTPTGRPFEADSSDGKEMLLRWRPKLRAVVEDWLTVLYKTARTRDPPEKFLDTVWMDAHGLNQVVHTLTLMNDEKSATLALRLVAGMFKIYGHLPVPEKPKPDVPQQSTMPAGTWDALQAAGLDESPSTEMDEEERLAPRSGRNDQEDNPWLTSSGIAEQRKSDLLAEESDFPEEVERDQDAKSSIFAMTSGMDQPKPKQEIAKSGSLSTVYEFNDEHEGNRGHSRSKRLGRHRKPDPNPNDPFARRGHVPEGEELDRFLTGPLFAQKGDALPVYTRRRELRWVLRNPRNAAMAHQLHTNVMVCCHIVGRPELYDWLAHEMGVPKPKLPEEALAQKTSGMTARKRRQVAAKMHKFPFGRPPTILPFDMRPSPFGRTRHLRSFPSAKDGHLIAAPHKEAGAERSRDRRRTLSKSLTNNVRPKGKKPAKTNQDELKSEFDLFSAPQEGEPEPSPEDTAWSTQGPWDNEDDTARSAFPGPSKFRPPSSRS